MQGLIVSTLAPQTVGGLQDLRMLQSTRALVYIVAHSQNQYYMCVYDCACTPWQRTENSVCSTHSHIDTNIHTRLSTYATMPKIHYYNVEPITLPPANEILHSRSHD